jgi:ATP-dependent exoDNAse (exonuclease V) beta subunit
MSDPAKKNFVVYKSSAGSGKTFTLVREYIRLVITNPERYANILAVTFTNKAANEMKSRILEYLKALAGYSASSTPALTAELADYLGRELNMELSQVSARANAALTLILHNYSNFAISTIDSFVHRLVRSFAKDLRLPVNFEVELDTDKLITKSIDLLISKVGTDPDLTMALVRFIETRMDDEKNWNIEQDLKKFTQNLLREDSYDAVKQLRKLSISDFIEISRQLTNFIRIYEHELTKPARLAMDKINAAGLDQQAFFQPNSGIYAYFKRIANGDLSKIPPNTYVLKSINENKWCSGKCSADDADAIHDISDYLTECYDQIRQVVEKGWQEYKLVKLVNENIYLVAVLSEIEKVMDEFRENENIVHISEFNKRISAIVQSESVPFIYERIGEKYRHFLLDEFQDTSLLQWHNLTPLLENSLSTGNYNMIVGDGKQAIYRWRNGEVEQFAVLPKIFRRGTAQMTFEREKLFESQFRLQNLAKNYRSHKTIVDFNNAFFNFAKNHLSEEFQNIYSGVHQEFNNKKDDGYVHIEFLEKDELTADEYQQKMLDRVLNIVQENLRHFTPEKIAVLTRRNYHGSLVARHLIENGISVVSSDVLMLAASRSIRFMISLLRFLLSPDDRIAAAETLTYLFQDNKIKADQLHSLFNNCREIKPDNPDALHLRDLLHRNGFNIDDAQLSTLPLPELFAHVIREFQLDEKGNDPFMQFFMDLVYEYNNKYNEPATAFLKYWDETGSKKSIIIPEATPSVRVMTIHKAKGLQFPVVIFPFAIEKSQLSSDNVWVEPGLTTAPQLKTALVNFKNEMKETVFEQLHRQETDKSLLDMLNILYVAMTRPKERLYVITRDKTNQKGEWPVATPFPDAADLLHQFVVQQNMEPDDANCFNIGTINQELKPAVAAQDEMISLAAQPKSGFWRQKIRLHAHAAGTWDTDEAASPRETGLLIHRVLSMITTRNDLDQAVNTLLNEGLIQNQQVEQLKSAVRQVLDKPAISPYFEEGNIVYNEKDILLADGSILRPDRVVIAGNKIVVIDYKTGVEDASHHKQLDQYVAALETMGYRNIEQHIVYIDPEKNLT